jgi:hypothetical protein
MVRLYRGIVHACSWMWAWATLKWSDVVHNLLPSLKHACMVRSYRGSACFWMWATLKWSDVNVHNWLTAEFKAWLDHTEVVHVFECGLP